MQVANTVELKNQTNRLLREVLRGEPVIITLRGKPAAALTRLTEDERIRALLARLATLERERRPGP